jgi:hypothetical protein
MPRDIVASAIAMGGHWDGRHYILGLGLGGVDGMGQS